LAIYTYLDYGSNKSEEQGAGSIGGWALLAYGTDEHEWLLVGSKTLSAGSPSRSEVRRETIYCGAVWSNVALNGLTSLTVISHSVCS
jgi:hypothetical protein